MGELNPVQADWSDCFLNSPKDRIASHSGRCIGENLI